MFNIIYKERQRKKVIFEMKEKKRLNKRVLLGGAAILIALLLTFVISPIYNKASESKCHVVRVVKDIKEGELISVGDIEVVLVGSFNMAGEVYKKSEEVLNQYATADLKRGDYIVKGKISDSPISANTYLWELDGQRQAVSISIPSFAAGLSGKLEAGDIVSVTTVQELENGGKEAVIPIELNYVEVLAVTAADGEDLDAQVTGKGGEKEKLPATITLLVSQEQLLKLAELEHMGKIHIALAYRGSEKQIYLELQKEIIDSAKELEKEVISEEISQGAEGIEEISQTEQSS